MIRYQPEDERGKGPHCSRRVHTIMHPLEKQICYHNLTSVDQWEPEQLHQAAWEKKSIVYKKGTHWEISGKLNWTKFFELIADWDDKAKWELCFGLLTVQKQSVWSKHLSGSFLLYLHDNTKQYLIPVSYCLRLSPPPFSLFNSPVYPLGEQDRREGKECCWPFKSYCFILFSIPIQTYITKRQVSVLKIKPAVKQC